MKRGLSDYITSFVVLLCSLVLLGALTYALSGYRLNKQTRLLYIDYADITGIQRHSEVRYAGAPAGRVLAFRHLTAQEREAAEGDKRKNAVRVTVEFTEEIPSLPADVKATLTAETLMSEKFIALSAGSPELPKLANGALIQGESGSSMDEAFAAVGPALLTMQETVASLQPVITKTEETLDSIKNAVNDVMPRFGSVADSAKKMSDTADGLLKRTDKLIADNEDEIQANLLELKQSLNDVQKVLGTTNTFVGRTDREFNARMQELGVVLQNLKVATTHAKAFTESVGEKPSRLIWGFKKNELTPEQQILRSNKAVPAKQPLPGPRRR